MIDTDKYTGHTKGPWRVENGSIHAEADWWSGAGDMIFFSKRHGQDANSQLVADAPLLLEEVKRLRHLCDTLFIYAHNIETGQSTIKKSNREPLSTIDFEKDMTWVNWVNQPKINNIKIGGISYLKILDDSIHSDGEADYVLATECKAGHLVGEIGYEDCPDCDGEEE